ncbi:cardiolipin synthase, partial [Staphylococcus gallinarum]|uniref:PLDc N-terminal domain-containing protein n=1 Tax=Staphylococcus gallinarum TaxID=1293 RepID=UPI000D44658C
MIDIFSLTFYHTNVVINVILISAFILNLIFAFTIIFMERRSAGSIWAWILVILLLPILG